MVTSVKVDSGHRGGDGRLPHGWWWTALTRVVVDDSHMGGDGQGLKLGRQWPKENNGHSRWVHDQKLVVYKLNKL